ncbi:MAG: FAD-dependent monooxygenase [Bacteroidota bacterium]
MKNTQVLVIGAGPSGMVTALCLAKLGVSSLVVERNSTLNPHPKAHELNTRSIEILHDLGFSDEELAVEASPPGDGAKILFCNTINEELGRIDLEEGEERQKKYKRHLRSSRPYLNISQTSLESLMLNKVKAEPLIEILFDHQWESLEETASHVVSQILNRANAQTFQVQSQYVIAADGAGSPCRHFLEIPMEGPDNMQEFVSAYFETNLRDHVATPAKLYWILNPHVPGTLIAHHIEKRWVYMVPFYAAYQKKEQFTSAFFEQALQTALGAPHLKIDIKCIGFWRMSAQLAKHYRKGKVLLVGDAAHRFPPTGGLGMNTGIADAHNIGWKITMALGEMGDVALLDTYETERRPIAVQNTEESVHNYHKILEVPEVFGLGRDGPEKLAKFQGGASTKWLPDFLKRWLSNLAISWEAKKLKRFPKDANLRARVATCVAEQVPHFDRIGLDIGYIYEKGALIPDGSKPKVPLDRVTQYVPTTSPGARFPHMDLSASGRFSSTHDLIGYRQFTLFIREAGQAWEEAAQHFHSTGPFKLEVVQLNNLGLPPNLFEEVTSICEIGPSGALLIRPDGHVAFRSEGPPPNSLSLREIFPLILQQQLTVGP